MKLTNINARMDKDGKHNDRNFDVSSAPHIDKDKIIENMYWTYNGDYTQSFDKIEQEFYEQHFSEHINKQNQINEKARHKERNKTVEQYRKSIRTRPEDKILQIGGIKEHATKEELWECACEYRDRFNAIYGENCIILDMALHMDEATPHVHVRRVWVAADKDGNAHVSQEKALEELGILPPDTQTPVSRFNNAKVSFTEFDLKLFSTICEEKGINVDKTPSKSRKRLSLLEYKIKEMQGDYEYLQERVQVMNQEKKEWEEEKTQIDDFFNLLSSSMRTDPLFSMHQVECIEELRKKKDKSYYMEVINAYKEAYGSYVDKNGSFESKIAKVLAGEKVRELEEFLRERGLYDEFYRIRNNQGYNKSPELTTDKTNDEKFY